MDWYPHHINDHDAETIHLGPYEDGCLRRLHDWYIRNERPLPDDDAALASICRIGLDDWNRVAAKVRLFFVTRYTPETNAMGNANVLHSERCDTLIIEQNRKRKDGKARVEKLRKKGISDHVTRYKRGGNAARGEERKVKENRESDGEIESRGEQPDNVAAPPSPSAAKTSRGSRLPDNWTPGDAGAAYATDLGLEPNQVFQNFRDYWIAAPGAKGLKADWAATWRTWCRKEAERRPGGSGGVQGRPDRASVLSGALRNVNAAIDRRSEPRRQPLSDADFPDFRS